MSHKKLTIFISITAVVLFILIAAPTLWFSLHSYNNIIDTIVQILNRPDLKKLLTEQLFTKESYQLVYNIHWIIYVLDILLLWLILKKRHSLCKAFILISTTCSNSVKSFLYFAIQLNKRTKLIILLLSIIYLFCAVYKISSRDIVYDEAWNYNYFIHTPAWFPFVLFNTYPLYHFTAHFFDYLPFSHTVNIRLPAVFAGLLFCWLLYIILTKIFKAAVAYLTIFMAVSSSVFLTYTCIAKGIIFCLSLSLIMFYAIIKLKEADDKRKFFLLYFIAGLLSIIAVPTNIIFCMAATLFLFIYNLKAKSLKHTVWFLILNIAVCITASFFYLTTIINPSAAENLFFKNHTESSFIAMNLFEQGYIFFQKTSCLFFANDFVCIILFALSLLLLWLVKNTFYRSIIILSCICIMFSLIIAIVTNNALPDRAYTFLFIPYIMIFGIFIDFIFSKIKSRLLINSFAVTFSITFIAVTYLNNYSFLNPPAYQLESKKVSSFLMNQHITTCYIQSHEFFIHYPIVLYYYTINNREWKMTTWQENSTRFKVFDIKDNYDCIITDPDFKADLLPGYTKKYTGTNFSVYIKV